MKEIEWGWTYYRSTHVKYEDKGTRYHAKFQSYNPIGLWDWEEVWIDFVTTTPVRALRAICAHCTREGIKPSYFFMHHIRVLPDDTMTSEAMYGMVR